MEIVCNRCVMDTTVPGIRFDEKGVCNYCKLHDEWEKRYPLNKESKKYLEDLVGEMKNTRKVLGSKYDCLVGCSGGVDSSYMVVWAKEHGLNPLVVHVDNHWNDPVAEGNVRNVTKKLFVDLHREKVDWKSFSSLQKAFLWGSTPDVEVPTDIGIKGIFYRLALENDIKYIVRGNNFRTEGKTPLAWGYGDYRYIKDVNCKNNGGVLLDDFKRFSLFNRLWMRYSKNVDMVTPLNYMGYDKDLVVGRLKDEFGWKSYGDKHFESIYTRWVASYLLPVKFNIDKRKVYSSALIRSGMACRDNVLKELLNPPLDARQVKRDTKYVLDKLGMTTGDLEEIMKMPVRSCFDYKNYLTLVRHFRFLYPVISKNPSFIFDEIDNVLEDMV